MSKGRNYGWLRTVLAGLFLVLWLAGGCGDSNKSALAESELARIAVAQKIELVKASVGLALMVGGEPITSD